MQYRKSVSIIDGGQTGKASCVCLPAAEWGDQDGACTNGESEKFSLDWIEPPPPPLLEDLFLDFVAWNWSRSFSSADGDLLLIRLRQGRPRMDEQNNRGPLNV
jgi:hypothetical protein